MPQPPRDVIRREPDEFETQDWIIVVEALANWSGPPGAVETPREERAWELIEAIGREQQLQPGELLRQIDREWSGPDS
jgi:hypothetical protein